MVTLSIKTDFNDVQRKLDRLSSDLQRKVVPAALNKVAAKAKTEMVRGITSEFNIKADEVRSRLRIIRANRKSDKWYAVLDPFATGRKYARKGTTLNLIRFVEKSVTLAEARRRKKSGTTNQLRFQIKKNGGRVTLKGAFIATNKSTGGTAVFTRVGKDRYPIQAKQTIDIPQMFNTRRINARVVDRIEREMAVEFDRAINAAINGSFR
jgi:hypothetical protein